MKARINKKSFINFVDFGIDSSLDAVASTFHLSAFFNPENEEQLNIFKPLTFNKIEIFDDEDKLILTGIILNHDFSAASATDLVQLSGYSLPGVIEDCNVPYSFYPLESIKMNLAEISRKLIKPFGLNLVIDKRVQNDVNLVYTKSVCKPEDSIKEYLSKLCAQRNIIISHDTSGNLLFFRPNINAPSKVLFSEQNTTSMSLSVNGQGMHSKLTILRQPRMKKKEVTIDEIDEIDDPENETMNPVKKKKKPKPQYFDTLKNPMIKTFRPAVRKMTEGEDMSTEAAVRNYMADELRNITFTIELNRWDSVRIGDIVEIQSKGLFLKKKIRTIIESISMQRSSEEKKMIINAVLPESFTGTEPKDIFL
jgi:prophage tail gpP-like protein